jgi:hypothetical protein
MPSSVGIDASVYRLPADTPVRLSPTRPAWETASFAEYVYLLYNQGRINMAHVGGANTRAFAENTDLPVTQHDNETGADTVLTNLLVAINPVVSMIHTVGEFMREFEEAVRTQEREAEECNESK